MSSTIVVPAKEERPARMTVTLPWQDYSRLVSQAKQHRLSASWVIRDAVENYLKQRFPLPDLRSTLSKSAAGKTT
jgi:hypothetical protein